VALLNLRSRLRRCLVSFGWKVVVSKGTADRILRDGAGPGDYCPDAISHLLNRIVVRVVSDGAASVISTNYEILHPTSIVEAQAPEIRQRLNYSTERRGLAYPLDGISGRGGLGENEREAGVR